MFYIVTYTGPFGFIKPWTAVRDSKTFSQQFLTPSIVEGIRQKLEVGRIVRHKLTYGGVSVQQEQTQPRDWEWRKNQKLMVRTRSILERGVLIAPCLSLAFETQEEAIKAAGQHICLCRNEDILLPKDEVEEMTEEQFDRLRGFELRFGESETSFPVGFNRFEGGSPMQGWLEINGKPIMAGHEEL